MNDPTSCQDEATKRPSEASEARKPRSPLEAIRHQLEEHSALEELGPLFGPEAQGTAGHGQEGL
jgi:hypothetical protein